MKKLKGFALNESGQSMVEFTFILPFLLLVFCIIIEFSYAFLQHYQAKYAAYEGARIASMYMDHAYPYSDDEISIAIRDAIANGMDIEEEEAESTIFVYYRYSENPGYGTYPIRASWSFNDEEVAVNITYDTKTLTLIGNLILANIEGTANGYELLHTAVASLSDLSQSPEIVNADADSA